MKKEGNLPDILPTLIIVVALGGWSEGSWHNGHLSSPGSLNPCAAFPISPNYCSFVRRVNLTSSLEGSEICRFTLPEYACGLDSNLTASQLFAILQCHITDLTAQLDQGAFLLLFGYVDKDVLHAAVSEINVQIPKDTVPEASKAFLLNAAWEKLKTDSKVQSAGFLATWFQELLHSYLTAISTNVLDCMTQIPITCDGFTVVVQALDSRYVEMDNGTKQMVASWIGRFLAIRRCQKSSPKEWIQNHWKRFLHFTSYSDLLKSWGASNGSVFLTEAEGSALEYMTPSQVAEMTAALGVLSNISLTKVVARALASKDVRFAEDYLNKLAPLLLQSPPVNDNAAMHLVLETILRKVNQSFPDLCSPSLKDLFQVKLRAFLPAADSKILRLLPARIGCTDFQDIYKGINSVHHELDPVTQKAVYKSRLDFLERQLAKEGVACMFSTSNSREWLQENFGLSSIFAAYEDFVRLNPSFNGFEVLDLLTATQMASLVVNAGILTDLTRFDVEAEAGNVMGVLQSQNVSELQAFLLEVNVLAEQRNIAVISNVKVRDIMLQGILHTLKLHFASMATADFKSWFGGLLTMFLPSVMVGQLQALPSPSNCTQLQTMVKGLDYAFDSMSMETKMGVAQWTVQAFQKQECQTTRNWVSSYFLRFQSLVNISDLMMLDQNFTGMAHLQNLSARQLAQLTLTEEVCGSMANVDRIFDRLAQLSTLEDLAAYWDEFNIVYQKANRRYAESQKRRLRTRRSLAQPVSASMYNISTEVKSILLARSMQWLHMEFPAFTDAHYQLWFERRLLVVLPGLTAAVLQQIPLNLSCGAYKSLISGINKGFSEIPKERKRDILNYIVSFLSQKSKTTGPACSAQVTTRNWLLQYFGKSSAEVPYTQLVSYYHQAFDAYLVLDLLTPRQIGNMIVHSETLTSLPLATQLVAFFQESSLDNVRMILKELTRAAIQHKMSVLPNSEVAQLFLANYLVFMSSKMEAYTADDWNATFHEELRFLCPAFNATTLAYIIPQDFKSISTIIAGLSEAHPYMTESSRRAVVRWIVQNSEVLKGYRIDSIAEWIQAVWGSFFPDATLEELKSINENFDRTSALGFLSISQLMEFVKTSDAPTNVTTMRIILSSLETEHSEIPLSKMHAFLTLFNQAIEQNKVGIREEVRLEILSTVFMNLARHFRTFTELDYGAWFLKLKLFLPSMNKDLLQMIPLDLGFPSYTTIIGSLDKVFPDLPQETSSEIYLFMKKILELQVNISGTAFPGTYKDSRSFLQLIFYQFAPFAKYADILKVYKDFNGYDVLPLLTAKQIGEMMILTNAIKHELLAVQILVELEKRPLAEVKDFAQEFNAVAHEKHLTSLPDLRICSLILETLFKALRFNTFSADQYAFWFGAQLPLFLSALSPKHLHRIPLDIDCLSHQNLVKALEKVYNKYTMDQKNAIHKRILSYLESYQKDHGVTCSPNANSSQWLLSNYGHFRACASLSEFSALNVNFNPVSAIGELFPRQLADVVVNSGALADGALLEEVMSHVGTLEDIADFLGKLNIIAPVELRSSMHASSVLSHVFQVIAAHFPGFKASNFTYWFQGALQNVLHAVNETLVAQIPLRLSCGSYQQILKGFNNIYANIPTKSSLNIFKFCKTFLSSKIKSGMACGYPTQSIPDWLEINLGNFSRYAEYQDLISWNLRFDGMTVLQHLSPPQLASLTLQSDAINEEGQICQILARLEHKPLEAIYQYLDQFNVEAQKLAVTSLKEEVIQKKMLSLLFEAIGVGFSTFIPENWTYLLTKRLALFLPHVGEKESKQILSHVSDCDSFRAIVSSLSHVYSAIPATNQESIYRSFFAFLESQKSTTGSACASKTRGTEGWLQDNLGAFAANAPYDDFTKLTANFNGFEVRGNLTSTQLAHVFFESGILDSPDAVRALLIPLESEETAAFVTEFASVASQRGITFLANVEVRDTMYQVIFSKLQKLFTTTTSNSQYKDWFQNKLNLWLPSINASALDVLPQSIPCTAFKNIMAGLDGAFQLMSQEGRNDVYAFAKRFLATKTSQGGDPCTENTRGSLGWLRSNFGSFSSLASYKDLVGIFAEFRAMDAREGLTPAQLADYTLASDVLRDNEKAGKIIGSLTANSIGEFMDAFNSGAKQMKLSRLPHQETRRFLLGEIFCHLSSLFPHFVTKDYTVWFRGRLSLFLSSMDTQNLGFIPSDLSCDSLGAIMDALTDHHVNNTFENPDDIASFIKRVLHSQLQNSGSACTLGTFTDRQWLTEFFGPFSAFCSYSDFVELKGDFRGEDSLDLFSANTLAQLSTQSHTIYSRPAMMRVFEVMQEKKDSFWFLATFLDEFNTIALKNRGLLSNPKVQHTVLMLAANMLFPQIDTVLLEDAAAWLKKLDLLLPGINGTMLELLPHTMPCPYYQIIVKALGDAYSKLSTKKRQDVYGFQKAYLAAQFADSGSACDTGNTGVRGWLIDNLGDFCSVAKLSELQAFYPVLTEIDSPAGLSPMQAADLTLLGPMCNSTLASMAVGLMKTFENYQSLHEYLYRLQSKHCQGTAVGIPVCKGLSPLASLTPEIQHEFFSNVLSFLKKRGTSMDTSQWTDIAQVLPSVFGVALNMSHHPQPPPNGTCENFQAAMEEIVTHHLSSTQWEEELPGTFRICCLATQQPKPTATRHIFGSTEYHLSGNSTGRPTTHHLESTTTRGPGQNTTAHRLDRTTSHIAESAVTSTQESAVTSTKGNAVAYATSPPALFYCILLPWVLLPVSF